jgi:hypothetical protein
MNTNNNFLLLNRDAEELIRSIAKDEKWIKEIDFSKIDSDQIIMFLLHLRSFITQAHDFDTLNCEEIDLLLGEIEKILKVIELFLTHRSEILTDEEHDTLQRKKTKLSSIREAMIEKICKDCSIPPHKITTWKSNYTIWKEAQNYDIILTVIGKKLPITGRATGKGTPPLLQAVLEGDYKLTEEILKTNKQVIPSLPDYGLAALSFAILLNHHDIAKLLIENGANIQGDGIANPFLIAYKKKDLELIHLFIEKGADPTIPSDSQNVLRSAFEEAELNPSPDRIEFIKTLLKCFLSHLNEQSQDAKPYLFSAIDLDDLDIIKMLVEKKVDLKRKWKQKTPLQYAQEVQGITEEESKRKILDYLTNLKE